MSNKLGDLLRYDSLFRNKLVLGTNVIIRLQNDNGRTVLFNGTFDQIAFTGSGFENYELKNITLELINKQPTIVFNIKEENLNA